MMEMNKVMLIGNLTRDPELSYLPSGMALAKLGLAVSRRFKGKNGEMQDDVAFVDVDAWAGTAEFASKWLKKGTRIYVEGRLSYSTWKAQDGTNRSKLSVTAEQVQFALPKSAQDNQGEGGGGYQQPAAQQQYAPQQPQQYAQPQQQAPYYGQQAPQSSGPVNTDDDLPF